MAPASEGPGRSNLPTGTVTFLRTDIDGSVGLMRALGDEYDQLAGAYAGLIRSTVLRHGGVLVRSEGDGFFTVFTSARDAAQAAAAIQGGVDAMTARIEERVGVRIGLHTGHVYLAGDDYGGLEASRAARIMDIAHGGQIVVSDTARALIAIDLPAGLTLTELGHFDLKGMDSPEHLFLLERDGHTSVRTEAAQRQRGHLPEHDGRVIGRAAAIGSITKLLAENRLVTLSGPGGSGKTTLALAVARQTEPPADGAWFIDLQTVTDPTMVRRAIATGLDLRDDATGPAETKLDGFLERHFVLLILDNFEQVIDAASDIAHLVDVSATACRFLVTSRIPLRVSAEQEFPVAPLVVPAADADPKEALATTSVELFIERTRRLRPTYSPAPAEVPHLVAICRGVDGLPLGIELAAARMAYLPPATIARLLAERLELPGDGTRDQPARHKSLRAAIAWSADLLGNADRALLGDLSVFAGGFGAREAEAVCGVDGGQDVLDAIIRLVDRSLVEVEPSNGGARFRLLEPIRQFACEILRTTGREPAVRAAHLAAYRDLAEAEQQRYFSPEQAVALRRLDADAGNLDAALRWAIASDDAESAFRLGAALWRYWQFRLRIAGHREDLEVALALPSGQDATVARMRALEALGGLCYWSGDLEAADRLYRAQLDAAVSSDDPIGIADAYFNLGHTSVFLEDLESGRAQLLESSHRFDALGLSTRMARVAWLRAALLLAESEPEAAHEVLLDGLDQLAVAGDLFYQSVVVGALALYSAVLRDYDDAFERLVYDIDRLLPALGDLANDLDTIQNSAIVLLAAGHRHEGEELYGRYARLCRRFGARPPEPPPFLFDLLGIATEVEALRSLHDGPTTEERADGDIAGALQQARSKLLAAHTTPSPGSLARSDVVAGQPRGRFVRHGDVWSISYGAVHTQLRDTKGLRYLERLLSAPGREFTALELATPAIGARAPVGRDRVEPLIDEQARRAYESRLLELQDDIVEAERMDDVERAARARDELEAIAAHVAASLGLGGRPRSPTSAAERARQSVTKAIKGALRRIERELPSLGDHLTHSIHTGRYCTYDPDPAALPEWTLGHD